MHSDEIKHRHIITTLEFTQGHPRAQYNAAWSFLNGRGTLRDQVRGVEWMRRAAAAGIMQARASAEVLRQMGEANV